MGGKRVKTRGSSSKLPKYCVIDPYECSRSVTETTSVSSTSVTETTSHRSLLLTNEIARAHLQDYYDDLNANSGCKKREVWEAMYEKYIAPNYTMVRASGNPLSYQGCIDILSSEDFTPRGCQLVSVDSVEIIGAGLAAVTAHTIDEKFTYKGNKVDDRVVKTTVLEVRNGEIKTVFEHRSTGQPIPKQSRWNAV